MTGWDWLVVVILCGIVVITVALDQLRDAGRREAGRVERDDSRRRLLRELEGK